jgi:hypothetical protein
MSEATNPVSKRTTEMKLTQEYYEAVVADPVVPEEDLYLKHDEFFQERADEHIRLEKKRRKEKKLKPPNAAEKRAIKRDMSKSLYANATAIWEQAQSLGLAAVAAYKLRRREENFRTDTLDLLFTFEPTEAQDIRDVGDLIFEVLQNEQDVKLFRQLEQCVGLMQAGGHDVGDLYTRGQELYPVQFKAPHPVVE